MIPASTEDNVSLDGVIAKLKALDRTSQRAEEILEASSPQDYGNNVAQSSI